MASLSWVDVGGGLFKLGRQVGGGLFSSWVDTGGGGLFSLSWVDIGRW